MLFLTPVMTIYILLVVFVLGAVLASFLGCMGWRISTGESFLRGRSHCDHCGHTLSWRDLIPIFSYLARRGKCAYCGKPIPLSTVVGELVLGVSFVLTTIRYDIVPELGLILFYLCILYLVSMTDIYERIIPDMALLVAVIVRVLWFVCFETITIGGALMLLLDGLSISLPLLLLTLLLEALWKKDAMGGGDIKLLFVIGLYLGWEKTLLAVFFACVLGIIGGTIQKRRSEDVYFAFGPYLAAASALSLWIGDALIGWYLGLFM